MNLFRVSVLAAIVFQSQSSLSQENPNAVKIVGKMKDVMWKGELFGKISLDTIVDKTNLYALGPVEYLTGEIMVFDGKAYKSTVVSDIEMKIDETFEVKAPFLGYANIREWTEHRLPENITTIAQLEQFLNKETNSIPRPFMFKLSGEVDHATIHIVNLPKGSKVSSPDEAHRGQVNYKLKGEKVDILGFFSTEHKAIFTHHDTFVHLHLITADRGKMGHLDEVAFKKGTIKLFLPAM